MERINVPSGSNWEDVVGYSRLVKIGNAIELSGTVSVDENGTIIGPDDAYEQTKYILKKIEKYLGRVGATMNNVIRTRIFVTDIREWENIGKAHGEVFKDIKPATSMVEVKRLIDDAYKVEIEVSAIL